MIQLQLIAHNLSNLQSLNFYLDNSAKWLDREVVHIPFMKEKSTVHLYEVCYRVMQLSCALMAAVLIPIVAKLLYNFCISKVEFLPNNTGGFESIDPPSAETLSNDIDFQTSDILANFTTLQSKVDALFENLSFLQGESGLEMEKHFKDLQSQFESYPDQHDLQFQSVFSRFKKMGSIYDNLRTLRFALFYDPPLLESNRIRVQDKGNCLYDSISIAMDLWECRLSMENTADFPILYPIDPMQLRQEAVKWEQEHIETDEVLREKVKGVIYTCMYDIENKIKGIEATNQLLHQEIGPPQSEGRKITHQKMIKCNEEEILHLQQSMISYQNPQTAMNHYFQQA